MLLRTVRENISTALDTIPGLSVYWYQADRPSVPFVIVKPDTADLRPHLHGASQADLTLTLIVCVSGGDDLAGQALLDAYLSTEGTSSISATLLGDPDASGVGTNIVPVSWQSYGQVELADGTRWFGAELTVEVYA